MNQAVRNVKWRMVLIGILGLATCACVSSFAFFIGRQSVNWAFLPGESSAFDNLGEPDQLQPGEPAATSTLPIIVIPTETPTEVNPPLQPELLDRIEPDRTLAPPMSRDLEIGTDDFELLVEVWSIIAQEFDGELPESTDLLYSSIIGSLETLDDEFTRFITPQGAARLREDMQGSFEGIGAFVRMNDDGYLEIVRPMSGQPASRAGLQPDDVILAVDGITTRGLSIDDAIARVRGPQGTSVVLTISREGVEEPFDVAIVRERIEIPTVEVEMLPEQIAYIRLTSFNSLARSQLANALESMLSQQPQALVFDLRDNPGGFLDQAVAVADLFLSEGIILHERNQRGLDEVFRAANGDLAETIPLVVLVNVGSASASEIVAGAIQDNGRGVLIGERTFGKGSVQQSHRLFDGSELRVTVARWYTPEGKSIDNEGITPDIEITPSPLELGGPEDTQLQRAIEYILTGQ